MAEVLIKGGCVLTMGRTNFAQADVLVEDGRIAEVGERLRSRSARVVDASDAVVMPGFVDAHRHVWKSLFRNGGYGIDTSRLAHGLSEEDVYAATMSGLTAAAATGITTVVDWYDGPAEAAHLEAAASAHHDSGLNTVLATPRPAPAEALDADRMAVAADDPSRDLSSTEHRIGEARSRGLRVHTHLRGDDSRGLAVQMSERGLLGADVTLVHCSDLSADDFSAIAASSAGVVLTPSTEMATGVAEPRIQDLLDRGLRPGLGIDDELLAPGDLFAQMRAVISVQHATRFDLKLAGKAGLPKLLSTRDVIKYGTIDGATAVGLGSETGSIEPGKRADLILLRTDRPNIFPVNDPIGAVVWGMDTSNLDWVFSGGRALMEGGELTADVDEIRRSVSAARAGLMEPSGPAGGGSAP